MKYSIKYLETFTGCYGQPVECYEVTTSETQWPKPEVWWDTEDKKAYCLFCPGFIAPVSQCCRHAKAVMRFKKKHAPPAS